MSFLSRKDLGTITLVVDISSGSTGAALVRNFKEGLPTILGSERTPFFINGEPDAEMLEGSMLSSLSVTLNKISKILAGESASIDKTLVTFSSPWIASHLKTVIIDRAEAFRFDEKMLREIIKEEKDLFLPQVEEMFKHKSEIFESAVTNLYLNGYAANSTVKEKVKKVEISFVLSAISSELLHRVENAVHKSVGIREDIIFHGFMYTFFKVLSHSFNNLHSALLLNMTSELTDTLFLRHGNSALTASLPFGPASVARAVAERLGVSETLAYSYLALFASGSFDQTITEAIDKVLVEVEERWLSLWRSMGESIPEGKNIPYSIFLIAPEGFEKLMKTFLEGVFENKNIILLGETNTFTKELVKMKNEKISTDENLLILSSFSNLLK